MIVGKIYYRYRKEESLDAEEYRPVNQIPINKMSHKEMEAEQFLQPDITEEIWQELFFFMTAHGKRKHRITL